MNKLYILCGIPFSGKSTLARKIVKNLGFTKIDLDEVKYELFGPNTPDAAVDQDGWDKIYQDMYKRIESSLKNGETVLQDAGNFTRYERGLVQDIARKHGIEFSTIFVNTPVEIAKERMNKNRETKERIDVSNEDFQSTLAELEPPLEDEHPIEFKITDSVEEFFKKL